MATCKICGSEFEPSSYRQKYCSSDCAASVKHEQNRGYNRLRRKPAQKVKCVNCGREFETSRTVQKCCSALCSQKNRTINQREMRRLQGKKASESLAERQCEHCGAEYKPKTCTQCYCSKECREAAEAEQRERLTKKPKHVSQINEMARQAAECNLDYGTYRAYLNMGKTYEELKALAPIRNPQVHQHTPRRER